MYCRLNNPTKFRGIHGVKIIRYLFKIYLTKYLAAETLYIYDK